MSNVQTYNFCIIAINYDKEWGVRTIALFSKTLAVICGFVGVIGMTYYM